MALTNPTDNSFNEKLKPKNAPCFLRLFGNPIVALHKDFLCKITAIRQVQVTPFYRGSVVILVWIPAKGKLLTRLKNILIR